MGYEVRLPAAPLKRELRRARRLYGVTWDELAVRLRISSRTLSRLLAARDVSEQTADRMACRLGLHPVLLWPRQWHWLACSQNGAPSRRENR